MKNTNHITYGLIGALILCVLFAIQWFAKIPLDNMIYKWLPTAVFALIIILGCMNFSKINDADVTFGQVFGNGFKTTAVITVIFALFFVIFILLFPEYKDYILDASMAQNAGNATPEQMAQGREMAEKFFLVGGLAGVVFIDLLIGVLASLIGAAIAKKKK